MLRPYLSQATMREEALSEVLGSPGRPGGSTPPLDQQCSLCQVWLHRTEMPAHRRAHLTRERPHQEQAPGCPETRSQPARPADSTAATRQVNAHAASVQVAPSLPGSNHPVHPVSGVGAASAINSLGPRVEPLNSGARAALPEDALPEEALPEDALPEEAWYGRPEHLDCSGVGPTQVSTQVSTQVLTADHPEGCKVASAAVGAAAFGAASASDVAVAAAPFSRFESQGLGLRLRTFADADAPLALEELHVAGLGQADRLGCP